MQMDRDTNVDRCKIRKPDRYSEVDLLYNSGFVKCKVEQMPDLKGGRETSYGYFCVLGRSCRLQACSYKGQ